VMTPGSERRADERLAAAGAAVIVLAMVVACRHNPPGPTPTPTPSIAEPNATAFGNLALIQSLERGSGRATRLVAVSARVERSGRVQPGQTWYYTFQEPSSTTVVTQWRIASDGTITSETYGSCGFNQSVDMAPLLGLDSDRIVSLALGYGAAAILDRSSEPKSLTVNYISGIVRVRVQSPECDLLHNGIEMDPVTGALKKADLSCTGTPLHPCVMPGVF
jgi:hypothetical protein